MARALADTIAELVALHREVGTVAADALRVTPTIWPKTFRREIRAVEARLEGHWITFMELDAHLIANAAQPSTDWNTATRQAAWFQMYFGVRDSVRGLLSESGSTLSELRNELVFRQSALLSVAAIVISLMAFSSVLPCE